MLTQKFLHCVNAVYTFIVLFVKTPDIHIYDERFHDMNMSNYLHLSQIAVFRNKSCIDASKSHTSIFIMRDFMTEHFGFFLSELLVFSNKNIAYKFFLFFFYVKSGFQRNIFKDAMLCSNYNILKTTDILFYILVVLFSITIPKMIR